MLLALSYVAGSIVFLLLLTFLYVAEDIKGERVFLGSIRVLLDSFLLFLKTLFLKGIHFFTNGFVRVLLHYGFHNILNRLLALLRSLEKRVEDLVRKNRKVVKDIHAVKTRNHLDEIAEHQEETALTDTQKEEMRSHEK